ncbi:MAG: surfeit locus 1 family protein [Halieaceae bacterium]|jgi:surfeit locus 1 family protein
MSRTHLIRFGPLEIKFNFWVAAAILISLTSLIKLGLWQLDRAELKRNLQTAYEQRQTSQPVAIEQISMADVEQLKNLSVSLAGTYEPGKNILIGNRTYRGEFGYEVITPFVLASDDSLVFISRGWIRGAPGRSHLPEIPHINGIHLLTGEIYIPPPQTFYRAQPPGENWPIVVSYFDATVASSAFDKSAFPYTVRLDENMAGVLTRPWTAIALKSSSSESYALQWFAMALAVVLVTLMMATNLRQLNGTKPR